MPRTLLLIDDDPQLSNLLARRFGRRDWQVASVARGRRGIEVYAQERPDLVMLDLKLPDMDGLEVLDLLRGEDPDAAAIVLTGHGDVSTAVDAMHRGAETFLIKPIALSHLEAVAERAYEKVALRRQQRFLTGQQAEGTDLELIGSSPAMQSIAQQVTLSAETRTTVLLQGETGTGKSWIARLIHAQSPRSAEPFVEINCAGLSGTLLGSELFGHERGAFTDAKSQKRGLFEVASGGTLLLDEIADLSPELQPKILNVLETQTFRRIGGTREISVDVRLVAATNRDLKDAVRAGEFREDLYYRLAVFPIHLPPLRERGPEDLARLVYSLHGDLRRTLGRGPDRISDSALELLVDHPWPGNIRELRNVLERVLILARDAEEVRVSHLPPEVADGGPDGAVDRPGGEDPRMTLEEVERRHIARVLDHCDSNRTRAARILDISRSALYKKLHRYGLM